MNPIRMVMMLALALLFSGAACGGLHTKDSSIWSRPGVRVRSTAASEEVRTILRLAERPAEPSRIGGGAEGPERPAESPGPEGGAERLCPSTGAGGRPSGELLVATISDGGFVVARGDGSTATIPTGSMPAFWRGF